MDLDIDPMRMHGKRQGAPLIFRPLEAILMEDVIRSGHKHPCKISVSLVENDAVEAMDMAVFEAFVEDAFLHLLVVCA